MRPRLLLGLVIALILASALPPPRVTNALIAASDRQDSGPSRKPTPSRARNRIGSPIPVDAARTPVGIDGGRNRSRPRLCVGLRHPEPALVPHHSRRSGITIPTLRRLRC